MKRKQKTVLSRVRRDACMYIYPRLICCDSVREGKQARRRHMIVISCRNSVVWERGEDKKAFVRRGRKLVLAATDCMIRKWANLVPCSSQLLCPPFPARGRTDRREFRARATNPRNTDWDMSLLSSFAPLQLPTDRICICMDHTPHTYPSSYFIYFYFLTLETQ